VDVAKNISTTVETEMGLHLVGQNHIRSLNKDGGGDGALKYKAILLRKFELKPLSN